MATVRPLGACPGVTTVTSFARAGETSLPAAPGTPGTISPVGDITVSPSMDVGSGGARRDTERAHPPLVGLSGRRWPARLLADRLPVAMHESQLDLHFSDYGRAVAAAGGVPVELTRDAPVGPVLDRLDALVLSGGADIDPVRYGASPDPECGPLEPDRDAWELELVAGALERSLPVFGICRGLQLLNVARGGTLVQHVGLDQGDGHPSFDVPRQELVHAVKLVPGTLAAAVYGEEVKVNSLHHQVVDRLGEGLVASGRSTDGSVEALELPGRPLLAVQWHPELLSQPDPGMRWLVNAALRPR